MTDDSVNKSKGREFGIFRELTPDIHKANVIVISGCHKKVLWTWVAYKQRNLLLIYLEAGSSKMRMPVWLGFRMSRPLGCRLLCSHGIFTGQREVLLKGVLILFIRSPPS